MCNIDYFKGMKAFKKIIFIRLRERKERFGVVEESLFYRRLRKQIKSKNKSFNQVERELGYPRNSLNNYKNGTEPSGQRLIDLAEYLGASPSYLIGKREESEFEFESLKESFQSLDFEQKRELYSICQIWATAQLSKNYHKNNK